MFPHTVTAFTKQDDDTYKRVVIAGVYWYGLKKDDLSGKGRETSSAVNVIIPLDKFDGIELDSYLVKGDVGPITSMVELEQYSDCITVKSIDINDVGSPLDNALVTGV